MKLRIIEINTPASCLHLAVKGLEVLCRQPYLDPRELWGIITYIPAPGEGYCARCIRIAQLMLERGEL